MALSKADPTERAVLAGALTWIIPGAGHFLLGHRGLAVVFFLAISIPYWLGLAIGGIANSVNLRTNRWLFLAEMGVGGYTTPCFFISQAIEHKVLNELGWSAIPDPARSPTESAQFANSLARYVSYYPESDIATIYLATAGLLNILAILDAITRGQTGGLPTYHRDLRPAPAKESAP